jgi:hypothetical protein
MTHFWAWNYKAQEYEVGFINLSHVPDSIRSIDIDIATAEGYKQPHPKLPEIAFQMDDERYNSIPRQLLNIAFKAREALLAEGPQPTEPPAEEEEQSAEEDGEREEEQTEQQAEYTKKRKRRGGQKHTRWGGQRQ